MKQLYKYEGKQRLVVVGHLNEKEITELRNEGYKCRIKRYNKHGIRVEETKC